MYAVCGEVETVVFLSSGYKRTVRAPEAILAVPKTRVRQPEVDLPCNTRHNNSGHPGAFVSCQVVTF